VVRERSAYTDTILRVCAGESDPLQSGTSRRSHSMFRQCAPAESCSNFLKSRARSFRNPKAGDIAHLLKTDYFRVSPEDLAH